MLKSVRSPAPLSLTNGFSTAIIAGTIRNITVIRRPLPRVAIQAFCETDLVANTFEQASKDRRMSKAHLKVQMGGIRAAVEFYQTATTPNLIFVESRLVGQELMGELEYLAEVCDEGTNVVVIGHKNDVQLYRELISRGVVEYLYAPITMTDVMEVVTSLFVLMRLSLWLLKI